MKKTLALLLAVLMMVSIIPFAAAAGCEHVNTVDWFVADGNGNHSTKKCSDCNEVLGSAKCTSSGAIGEGVCDWCGTKIPAPAPTPDPAPCQHTNTVDWYVADGKGHHSTDKCSDCGELLGSEKCTSTGAVAEGVCDWCGTTIPTSIPSTPLLPSQPTKPESGLNYDYNSTFHWLVFNGMQIPNTAERHTFASNGKCKVCGYKDKYYDWDYDYGYGYGDYKVTVYSSSHGKTTVSDRYADAGEYVTIYVDPDYGYKVCDVEVETRTGRNVTIHKRGTSSYYFTMPKSNVTVKVTYSKGNGCYDDCYDDCYDYDCYGYNFKDVDSNAWYYSAVKFVTDREIMECVSYNKFAPNANMTRAALAEALYAIANTRASGTENFSDVDRYDDYYNAVVWCSNKDIIEGWNGKFYPNGDITREDFAVMMYRYAQYKRANTKAAEDLSDFSDADDVSEYAIEAMEWAVAEGLINGMGDGTLNPQGTTTRAQAAAILMRLVKNVL